MHVYDLDSNDGVTDMDHVRGTLERMFPTEHECGIIPSVFATVERTEWAHRRESITAELLTIAEDAIAEERFAPADDDQPLGITARTDGGYLAVLMHDGERVCTLVGCDLDSISERICDFDLPSDKVAVPIDRARQPEPPRHDPLQREQGRCEVSCIHDCIGLTVAEFRKRGFSDYDWSNRWPVIGRASRRHAWRICEIVDSSEADQRGMIGVDVLECGRIAVRTDLGWNPDWFISQTTAIENGI